MKEGPKKNLLVAGCLNTQSICNKVPAVLELLSDNKVDVCFMTETWLKCNDKAKFAEIREYGFDIFSAPRKGRGGGVAFIFNPKHIKLIRNNVNKYKSFKVLETVLERPSGLTRLSVVYRSTQTSTKNKYAETRQIQFYQEFADYLDEVVTKSGRPIICGDFNFHVEDLTDSAANKLKDVYTGKGFIQHNSFATHGNSTLDLVLTCEAICDQVQVNDMGIIDESPSNHSLVTFNIPFEGSVVNETGTKTSTKEIRKLSNIDIDTFKEDIIDQMPSATDLNSLDEAVEAYIFVLSSLLDKHAPSTTTKLREGKNAWWTSKCQDARRVF